MISFVIGLILLLIGLGWLIARPGFTDVKPTGQYDQRGTRIVEKERISLTALGFIPLVLAALLIFISCWTVVGTKNVGVPTVFGKTTGDTYGAGLHFKAPWVGVTDIDGTVKPEEYKGDDCIYVKIADGGTACISIAYRWRINPDHADVAYADYRNAKDGINEGIRAAIVSTNMKAAINEAFGPFEPLSGLNLAEMTPNQIANVKVNVLPDYKKYADDIKASVEDKISNLGGLVEIQSVTISFFKMPDGTQDRINKFNAEIQNARVASASIATKAAQAEANEKLAASLKDPNVLVSKCLDSLAAGEFAAPAGFSCWPGSGSSVVIPSGK